MEDREGNGRLRRHHRRLLPPVVVRGVGWGWKGKSVGDGQGERRRRRGMGEGGRDGPEMEEEDLGRRTCCEQLTFLEGRGKYVCASFADQSYDSPVIRTAGHSEFGLLRVGTRRGPSVLGALLQAFVKSGGSVNGGQQRKRNVTDARGLVVGGMVVAFKIASLLLSRSLCAGAWPVMQMLSICTLPFGAIKQLALPQPAKRIVEPIARPVLGLTIAQPFVWLCFPNVYRTARFWKRLLPIYFRYIKTKRQVRKMTPAERDKVWAVRHEWGGEKVHSLVLDMSGFYVKSAQILATKADFVPEPWIRRLSNHLDNAPPRPFPEVERSIMQQLATCPCNKSLPRNSEGLVPLDAVFLHVDTTAIAAASIAQVHAGVLKDNTRVVIKVQHLGMEKVMASDLQNIGWVAKFLEGQLPFDLVPIVKEIQATIPLEFDFAREVWFMAGFCILRLVRQLLADSGHQEKVIKTVLDAYEDYKRHCYYSYCMLLLGKTNIKRSIEANGFEQIICPAPVLELCSKRLIVMERLDGVPFTHILHSRAPEALQIRIPEVVRALESLVHAYGQMLFIDGVFHADPHAGNLLLLPDGRLGLLDFGQSKVLEKDIRLKLAHMIKALASTEDAAIARALIDLGLIFEDIQGGEVSESRLAIMARILFDTCYVQEATVSPMSQESILRTTPLRAFNQSVWMVVRALVILRGLCFALKMDLSATAIWFPYAQVALTSAGES